MQQFDLWNEVKKKTQNNTHKWTIKPREIYWVKIGYNIDFEQNGKGENFLRPVLVLKKFSKSLFLGIPLTSQDKTNHPLYHRFIYKNAKQSFAILPQIRLFDTKRIVSKSGKINTEDYIALRQKLKKILEL